MKQNTESMSAATFYEVVGRALAALRDDLATYVDAAEDDLSQLVIVAYVMDNGTKFEPSTRQLIAKGLAARGTTGQALVAEIAAMKAADEIPVLFIRNEGDAPRFMRTVSVPYEPGAPSPKGTGSTEGTN